MGVGLHGVSFASAAKAVEEENSTNIDYARIRLRNMAEKFVRARIRCLVSATHRHVQVKQKKLTEICTIN